jgi:hypothetical protein
MSDSKTPIVLEKDFLNVNEAAMYMGCTPTGFRKMAKAFDIPSAKVPGGRIICTALMSSISPHQKLD